MTVLTHLAPRSANEPLALKSKAPPATRIASKYPAKRL